MKTYHVKCSETVNFTVAVEAETEDEARELAHADINSHEVIAESTTEWDIDEVVLESEEWYNKWVKIWLAKKNFYSFYHSYGHYIGEQESYLS